MFIKHYTSDIDLIDKEFSLAENHLYYFYSTIAAMEKYVETYKEDSISEIREDDISEKIISDFIKDIDDDFNTVAALSNLHGIFKYVNNIMKTAKKGERVKTANTIKKILENLHEVYGIIGLFKQEPKDFVQSDLLQQVTSAHFLILPILQKTNTILRVNSFLLFPLFQVLSSSEYDLRTSGFLLFLLEYQGPLQYPKRFDFQNKSESAPHA